MFKNANMIGITQDKVNTHPMLVMAPQHSRNNRCFEDEKRKVILVLVGYTRERIDECNNRMRIIKKPNSSEVSNKCISVIKSDK